MSMYFFDVYSCNDLLIDIYGIELVDDSEAIDQAEEMTKTLMSEGKIVSGVMEVAVRIKSASGCVIHTVHGGISSRSTTDGSSQAPSLNVNGLQNHFSNGS